MQRPEPSEHGIAPKKLYKVVVPAGRTLAVLSEHETPVGACKALASHAARTKKFDACIIRFKNGGWVVY